MTNFITQVQNDSLTMTDISQKTENITNNIDNSISIWFWIALIELTIILFLIIKLRKKKSNLDFSDLTKDNIKSAKSTNIDMTNLMNSINGSKDLYKKLSRLCHPDRFVNSDKHQLAEKIFQEISKNKRDFNKLSELKQRAISELKINFK